MKAERPIRARRVEPSGGPRARRVADLLDGAGVPAIHDRYVPGSRCVRIDHVAVGRAGVHVVQVWNQRGPVEKRLRSGFLRSGDRLHVAGRDRSRLLARLRRRADVVRGVLDRSGVAVPVVPVLCVLGADWGTRLRPLVVAGVICTWPEQLPAVLAAAGPLDPEDCVELLGRLAFAMPSANGVGRACSVDGR